MKSRITFLLSLVLAGTLATTALADPKTVSQKKTAPASKEVKREQVRVQRQTPPQQQVKREQVRPPQASERVKREQVRVQQQTPPPERVKAREVQKPKDAPSKDRFQQWNTPEPKKVAPPQSVRQTPKKEQRKDSPSQLRGTPPPATKERRPVGGEIAPKPGRERNPQVIGERAPQPKGPMPTFLKGRPTESLKKQLPKQRIEGTIESIEDEKAIVRTRDGRRAVVQIGPESYRQQKNIRLERGQAVSVDGWGEWSGGNDRGEGFFFAGGIYGPGYHFEFADHEGYPYWADRADYCQGWYPSWDAFYIYFWGPPPWWAYAPPPWYYRPPYWWHRHYHDPYYYPRHHRPHHRRW